MSVWSPITVPLCVDVCLPENLLSGVGLDLARFLNKLFQAGELEGLTVSSPLCGRVFVGDSAQRRIYCLIPQCGRPSPLRGSTSADSTHRNSTTDPAHPSLLLASTFNSYSFNFHPHPSLFFAFTFNYSTFNSSTFNSSSFNSHPLTLTLLCFHFQFSSSPLTPSRIHLNFNSLPSLCSTV